MSAMEHKATAENIDEKGDVVTVEEPSKFHGVQPGAGKTAGASGATTKEVHSVSTAPFPRLTRWTCIPAVHCEALIPPG